MRLNLGCGHILKPTDEGWTNVDKYAYPGVKVMDLFKYPWDFRDNSCEEFYMSHFAEHIPHEPKPGFKPDDGCLQEEWKRLRWLELEKLDGFFAFFAEIWRIGINGSRVTTISPYGLSTGAFQDPTHTRYIVPQTFSYLMKEDGVRFSYNLPLAFKIIGSYVSTNIPVTAELDKIGDDEQKNRYAEELIRTFWNYGNEITAVLEVVK